jgi:hypothetical protein
LKRRHRPGVGEAKERDGERQRLDPQERQTGRREQPDNPPRPRRPPAPVTA